MLCYRASRLGSLSSPRLFCGRAILRCSSHPSTNVHARRLSTLPPLPPPLPSRAVHPPARSERGELALALRRACHLLWDDPEPNLPLRITAALLCMVGAKLLSIQVPFLFKHAVDLLGEGGQISTMGALALTPTALMLLYGVVRTASDGLTQLRNALFIQVTEGALRRMALRTFRHLHSLELQFHLNRQTGGALPLPPLAPPPEGEELAEPSLRAFRLSSRVW